MRIYSSWLEQQDLELSDFYDWLESNGFDTDPSGEDDTLGFYWEVTGDDVNGNGIPDSLDELLGIPLVTNPSQGGHLG